MTGDRAVLRERRLAARMLARGDQGLAETLLRLKGVVFSGRYRFDSLFAVGGEGAVYLVRDEEAPARPLVGKVPLHATHRPFDLTAQGVRDRRRAMRHEAVLLETNGSPWMPEAVGAFQFRNPALPARRGGAFTEAEPVVVMERLTGIDVDRWLARVHASRRPVADLGPVLDRIAAEVLAAVADLRRRGFHYADLRPGNVRLVRRPGRHVRMLDAGSLVPVGDRSGRFPHVPAYLPPDVFAASCAGRAVPPDDRIVAAMAGRTLHEIVTGDRTFPGDPVDTSRLAWSPASAAVLETVALLCAGEFPDVGSASEFLASRGVVAAPAPLSRPTATPRGVRTPEGPAATAPAWTVETFLADEYAPPPAAPAPAPVPAVESPSQDPAPVAVATEPERPRASAPRPAAPRVAVAASASRAAPRVLADLDPWWRRLLARLSGRRSRRAPRAGGGR